MKKFVIVIQLVLSIGAFLGASSFASASSELSITGNGANSDNAVNVSSSSNVSLNQSNTASVQNSVSSTSNTGDNHAFSNTGSTSVSSGSVIDRATIRNENINSNSAQSSSAGGSGRATITQNGQNSNNTIAVTGGTSSTVNQQNTAAITNTTTTTSNTGGNSVHDNKGNTTIHTGDIYSSTTIVNKDVNASFAQVGVGGLHFSAKIAGNGADSDNLITARDNSKRYVDVRNYANSTNTDIQYLTTGKNSTSDNLGGVFIVTGNIYAKKTIANVGINTSVITISKDILCDTPKPSVPPTEIIKITPPNTPSNPGGGGGGGNNGNGGTGGGGGPETKTTPGEVLGKMLPVTGSYWLILLTLGNLIIFFMGWYLRFRSGIAPGGAIA